MQNKTTKELIEQYAFEASRENEEDRARNQLLIRRELTRRFVMVQRLLDDEQTRENPEGTYNRLING